MLGDKQGYWDLKSRSRRRFLGAAALGVAGASAAAVVGCGSDSKAPATKAVSSRAASAAATAAASGIASTTTPTPQAGGTFTTWDQGVQINNPDIQQTTSSGTQALAQYVQDGLMMLDEEKSGQFTLKPQLVTSWEQADPTTLVLKVRDGVKFANVAPLNGRALTADDVVYSLKRMATATASFPRHNWFKDVASWEATDPTTVKITTKQPVAALTYFLAHPWTTVIAKEQVDQDGGQLKTLMGSGPYILDSLNVGNQAVFKRNPDYWDQGRPLLDSWKFISLTDQSARMAAFKSGQVDYTDVPKDVLSTFAGQNPSAKQMVSPLVGIYLIGFNNRRAPYSDVRVRQAIASAVDIDGWIDVILGGDGLRTGPMAAAFPKWAIPREKLPYLTPDLKKAKDLLQAAGVPDGFKLNTITFGTQPSWVNQAVQMQQDLAQIGIEVTIERLSAADYQTRLFAKHDFDVVNGGDYAAGDPSELADRYSSSGATNWAGYANATVDKLFTQQASTLDATERQDLVTQLQMTMMEDVASDFTMIMLNRYFYNPKAQSFRVSALNGNAERWDARQTFKTTA